MVGAMTTLGTTDAVPVDPVRAGPETPWEPLERATENLGSGLVSRPHATVTAVLGDGGRIGEEQPPGWRPVAGDSAVWDG